MKLELRINIIGQRGLLYFKRTNPLWMYVIYICLMMSLYGVFHLNELQIGIFELLGFIFGLPLLLTILTEYTLDVIQREDIYLITDDVNYLVFLLRTNPLPVEDSVINNIENNVFRSFNPNEPKGYYVLKISDFDNMTSRKLFWINGNCVHMEYCPNFRGFPKKFNSTAMQQELLERINSFDNFKRRG